MSEDILDALDKIANLPDPENEDSLEPTPVTNQEEPQQEDDLDDWALQSFMEDINEGTKHELRVVTEHRTIRLEGPLGVYVEYEQDQWEEDPDLVIQIAEDLVCGLRRGTEALEKKVRDRMKYYGDPIGIKVSEKDALEIHGKIMAEQAKAEAEAEDQKTAGNSPTQSSP